MCSDVSGWWKNSKSSRAQMSLIVFTVLNIITAQLTVQNGPRWGAAHHQIQHTDVTFVYPPVPTEIESQYSSRFHQGHHLFCFVIKLCFRQQHSECWCPWQQGDDLKHQQTTGDNHTKLSLSPWPKAVEEATPWWVTLCACDSEMTGFATNIN